jgi:hypothetical protein
VFYPLDKHTSHLGKKSFTGHLLVRGKATHSTSKPERINIYSLSPLDHDEWWAMRKKQEKCMILLKTLNMRE